MQALNQRLAGLIAFGVVALAACGDQRESRMASVQQPIDWPSVVDKRVLFAHQSVGTNILSGVERLAKSSGVTMGIHELGDGPLARGITHLKIGRNGDPQSKISEYVSIFEAAGDLNADVALMKLCYIDFDSATDARKLAEDYVRSVDALAQRYPNTTFVAVTAPLTTVQTGPKAWIKMLLGRAPAQHIENAKRAEFNSMLRAHYLPEGRLFDLARVEAGGSGGHAAIDTGGRKFESLDPALTDDGGHLNERGQDLVAAAFLNLLGALPKK